MELLLVLLNKIFVFAFIFSILLVIYEIGRFVRGLNTGEYSMPTKRLIWVAIALSFIITMLITGFII